MSIPFNELERKKKQKYLPPPWLIAIGSSITLERHCYFYHLFFWLQGKENKETNIKRKGKNTQKELLSRKVNSNCVHPKQVQKVFRGRGVAKQLVIRSDSKFDHKIRTLITLSKRMANSYISLFNQILHILDQDRVNMIPHCRTLQCKEYEQQTRSTMSKLFAKVRP